MSRDSGDELTFAAETADEAEMMTSANNTGVPTRVVLLACGSFNPVTNMHLRMFELARDALNRTGRYRVVAGVASPVNDSYAKKDLLCASHRCAMLKTALQSSDWIRLDTWETEQDSWTETVKVLQHQKDIFETLVNSNDLIDMPQKKRKFNPDLSMDECDYNIRNLNDNSATTAGPLQVKLLCGADLLESFGIPGVWKDEDIEEIVSKFGLVIITREGSNPEKFIYESDVLTRFQVS
ncbi:Nicotinamide/nicotinic acid mononucleotide adenylyltransferase 1 [Lamellibrachia satsuma]|nr:Nicotinamide/nicotinic acid mononucleotide adenylyltransferase 1 [Lamellibrachia satsuma]